MMRTMIPMIHRIWILNRNPMTNRMIPRMITTGPGFGIGNCGTRGRWVPRWSVSSAPACAAPPAASRGRQPHRQPATEARGPAERSSGSVMP